MPNYVSSYTGAEIDESVEKYLEAKEDGGYISLNALNTILGDYSTSSSDANTYLPLSGGTMTGLLKLNNSLHLYGTTIGNTASDMISGTAGLFSWGDTGPKITFDTSADPGGAQAGALIFTDHDTAGAGVSWHFVSNQSDWNVISKRFHARNSISIGTNLPNTSYALYVKGDTTLEGNVSFGSSNTSNYISIHGLTGDAASTQWANHYFIGNRHWADSESSELVLFSGNDVGNGNSATTVSGSGPDRIRFIAAAHLFQTYSSAVSGAFETVCTSSALVNIFEINTNRLFSYKNFVFNDAEIGIQRAGRSVAWVNGRNSAIVRETSSPGYHACISIKTTNGSWEIGAYDHSSYLNKLIFSYVTDSNYNSGSNTSVVATISAAGAFTNASKREFKENIKLIDYSALDIINSTQICSFNMKGDEGKDYRVGFIADDTNPILSGKNQDVMDLQNCIGILMKAVQELSDEIDKLKKQ